MKITEKDILDKIWPKDKLDFYGSVSRSLAPEDNFSMQNMVCVRDESGVSITHSLVDLGASTTILNQIIATRQPENVDLLVLSKINSVSQDVIVNDANFRPLMTALNNRFMMMHDEKFEAYKKKDSRLADKLSKLSSKEPKNCCN